jgi:NAD(P)-dependent dehydrogenase (short-subunit alcohol dehydrogenase family)
VEGDTPAGDKMTHTQGWCVTRRMEVAMNGNYSGKQVLITGAAGGIGRACAFLLAEKGASLTLVDIDFSGLEKVAGGVESRGAEARWYVVDVSDAEEVGRLHQKVCSDAGVPDILVNSAGVAETAAIEEAPLEDWRNVLGVNLWGSIHTLHYFLPGMYERGSGHVVNLASFAGLSAVAFEGPYVTSKFAIVGLTKTLRAEASVHGVGVSVICPGFIDTPMLDNVKSVGFAESDSSRLRRFTPGPEKLALKILACIDKNRPLLIYPAYYRTLLWVERLTPRGWDALSKKLAGMAYRAGHIGIERPPEP